MMFELLFQEFLRIFVFVFEVISYYVIPSALLKLLVYAFKLILFMFSYSLNNMTTSCHLSY